MPEEANRKRTHAARGWLIAGASLAVLFGVIALKARADSGEDGLN